MVGKLNRFLHGVKPWHVIGILALVAIAWSIGIWVQYLQAEKEHIETAHVWTPHNAVPINLLGLAMRLDSHGSIFWRDTHTFLEYQQLDAAAHFFALQGDQIRYLAIVRKSDDTVSVARTTISANIPDSGFLLEKRDVTFDSVTGMVTAQYARPLIQFLKVGVMLPFLLWFIVSIPMGMARRSKWNEPLFPLKRVPA